MASLRSLVESAWSAYLSAGGISANVYTGFDSNDKTSPAVICKAVSAEEDPIGSGNFKVQCEISTRAAFDCGLTAFDSLCDAVNSLVTVNDLHAQLSGSVSGFTCWGTAAEGRKEWDTEEDCWVEKLTAVIYCAATDFS